MLHDILISGVTISFGDIQECFKTVRSLLTSSLLFIKAEAVENGKAGVSENGKEHRRDQVSKEGDDEGGQVWLRDLWELRDDQGNGKERANSHDRTLAQHRKNRTRETDGSKAATISDVEEEGFFCSLAEA
jgi:hypothetical protein